MDAFRFALGRTGTRPLRRRTRHPTAAPVWPFLYKALNGDAQLLAHESFVQPADSNPLYIDTDRRFEPLTDTFAADPLLHALLALLGRIAIALDDVAEWSAKVTPFRVLASVHAEGQPTPEGLHRDGVTLVTSPPIGRDNATGGESTVVDMTGETLLVATLCEPGTLLLGDDRKTLHGVSPIRPVDPTQAAGATRSRSPSPLGQRDEIVHHPSQIVVTCG